MTNLRSLAAAVLALLATPALATDMAFFIKNQTGHGVALELVSRDRDQVWPGGDEVYLIDKAAKKSLPVSCNAGERICYAAWINGDDTISFGLGPDRDQACETCCYICVEKTTETIELGQ